jgi:hypothetical protein
VIDVAGRRDDPLKLHGIDGKPVTLLPLALTTLLEEQAGVFNFQLRQRDAKTLELHLPSTCPDAEATATRCRKVLQLYMKQQTLAKIAVIVMFDADNLRGRSGKTQRVVGAGNH